MQGQMDLFDWLYPDRINPIREVAKIAGPYWTTSRKKLIDLYNTDPDIGVLAAAVREEYCPYEAAGHYGLGGDKNSLQSYDMRRGWIHVRWKDETGKRQIKMFRWEDFAREIADMIMSGEYAAGRENTDAD